jgi:formate hydrogenlyase subunit 6/NADH:ubiquinone oxidoreductase subunit I
MPAFKMVTMVFKALLRKPVTERYPFVKKAYVPGSRGQVTIEISKCIFCGICQRKCPTAAIGVAKEAKTWDIERMRCISCNSCVEVCPKKCLALDTQYAACSTRKEKDVFKAAA